MTLSGAPISSFPAVGGVKHDDLFLIASPADGNHMFYDDEKIDYWSMCTQMLDEISSRYRLRSMAWEDENAYSLSGHNHDELYNNTSIDQIQQNGIKIASFVTRTDKKVVKKTDVYFPPIIFYKQDEPYIGELKFVSDTIRRNINIYAADFDGWVYADGTTYSGSLFPSAQAAFNPGQGNETFAVPRLERFLRIGNSFLPSVDGQEAIPNHNHIVNLNFESSTKTGTIEVQAAKDWDKGSNSHNSPKDSKNYKCTMQMKIDDIQFNGNTSTGTDIIGPSMQQQTYEHPMTHPSYNFMPVMVYIGRRGQ